eukprot:m.26467 g.26467  ORF g.26467 m.26467 type:complete len:90 (+) comp13330_c0_seq1:594-863(+)
MSIQQELQHKHKIPYVDVHRDTCASTSAALIRQRRRHAAVCTLDQASALCPMRASVICFARSNAFRFEHDSNDVMREVQFAQSISVPQI